MGFPGFRICDKVIPERISALVQTSVPAIVAGVVAPQSPMEEQMACPVPAVLCSVSAVRGLEGFVHPTDSASVSSPSSSAANATVWAVRFASSLL